MNNIKEENPFEEETVAQEWINSVENEKGMIRDNEIYPILNTWVREINPQNILEIGSGQGICSQKIDLEGRCYIGIEPSNFLLNRARQLYKNQNIDFIKGNAYELPIIDKFADAIFSVNVWFHLGDLKKASAELMRVLKPGGEFLIITSNPDSNVIWESLFFDNTKDGKKLDGKVKVPINPLSRNIIYLHTLSDMTQPLENVGLEIKSVVTFGKKDIYKDYDLFIAVYGKKLI